MANLPQRFPYWPRDPFGVDHLAEIWRPPEHLFLSEVVEKIGPSFHGHQWTGGEITSRRVSARISEQIKRFGDLPPFPVESGVRPRSTTSGSVDRWNVITTQGQRVVESRAKANELWHSEYPKLMEMWREELAERQRFESVVSCVRNELYRGTVKAWAYKIRTGDLVEIHQTLWGKEGVQSAFTFPINPFLASKLNIIAFDAPLGDYGSAVRVTGHVVVREADLKPLLMQRSAAPIIMATTGGIRECTEWIRQLADTGPKPAKKAELWKQAQKKWPDRLSYRGFEAAWNEGAPPNWRKSGRPKTQR